MTNRSRILDYFWVDFAKWATGYKELRDQDTREWHIKQSTGLLPGFLGASQTTTVPVYFLTIDEHNFWKWYLLIRGNEAKE